ncbi:MAG: L-aspartate oxidase [Cyanobacteria bacterium]|nr:L-aspartate oxidase [Cyanobacteria bacterium CG_2015-16_32_12]NCO78491.1 L-aspartate oxidase [Cyanobacteria bacterium CG_2015-22_32_23]NCQ03719.1 L-aspartate oxidase [Cyanobacteria bacterium CG_2015-09_32_10]NCQ41065.1 L-aspartate oxidase [Cyanobacteria bacterium CG_2015-04_32_10]NCS83358.1 L-aspartate oxidase [Cyanobacteria bacterium CG_2015-02_32_10]
MQESPFPLNFDVIIVGSGAAGLYTALSLPNNFRIALVTKDKLKRGASDWAQGGIAAAINPDDSPLFHLQDTLKAGVGLCDTQAVKYLVENAAISIQSLLEMGVDFDRVKDDNNNIPHPLAMTLEAAHSFPRVLHAADTTGRAIVSILRQKVLDSPHIQVYEQAYALSLWLNESKNQCLGISLLYENQIRWLSAKAVILATGGGGQVFAQTTNPHVSTGDGVALAWRSGAILRDLEFVQFHPTALNMPNTPHFLISEAVRGEGAHLVDEEGKRFAFDYHEKGELAPRDVVSRAIYSHLHKTCKNPALGKVYLDLRPISPSRIEYRFPNIIDKCQQWGIDLFSQRIPVSPAAHYWMGGVCVNLQNQTSINGLYAIGETASTGVHGANRLASNSLLECVVFAENFRHLSLDSFSQPSITISNQQNIDDDWQEEMELISHIRASLPITMWEGAGICRTKEGLEKALHQIDNWRIQLETLSIYQFINNISSSHQYNLTSSQAQQQLKLATETINLLDVGYLILKSASFRTESRGGHYRLDYPHTDDNWQIHTLVKNNSWWQGN